jgi:NADPH-dependent glutamate synthase beta subunit-like oxidoreductase
MSPSKSHNVAVVGAGPAGISCAYYLALNGYQVTIFESTPVVGGMLYLGIPEYRLPRYLIRMEFERVLHLGVEIKTGWALGQDFSLGTLKDQGYDAVFLGIGTTKSKSLSLPGSELDGVINGIDFLINVNLGYKVELAERVIVGPQKLMMVQPQSMPRAWPFEWEQRKCMWSVWSPGKRCRPTDTK